MINPTLKLIKTELTKIGAAKVVLFGSRVTNNADKYSDYDILAIFNSSLNRKEKMSIASQIRKKMSLKLIDTDILVRTNEDIERSKNQIGSVIKTALREGVTL